jgi:hypothetical protein
MVGQGAVTGGAGRRLPAAAPGIALVLGGLVLASVLAGAPLAGLAHQSLNADDGSVPVWVSAGFGVLGLLVAWRRPRNPLGWVILAVAGLAALSEDAGFYAVADYRLRHGELPLGWLALVAQVGGRVDLVLFGLVFLLFPDGRPPSSRWRWLSWVYVTVGVAWTAGALGLTVEAITGHHVRVDSTGNLAILYHAAGAPAWWNGMGAAFFPSLVICWLLSLGGQLVSYRRSSWERHQQLKWLMSGSGVAGVSIVIAWLLSGSGSRVVQVLGDIAIAGALAIPISMGVAILKYRLLDIDRIISRTLAYAIVTGLLVGVYAGLVLLATQVIAIKSPVAVAASTLAVAALFTPVRRRVQRVVDRRFNRARYDAEQIVAAFAARLHDAVDLDGVVDDLAGTVQQALEPACISVWVSRRP